MRRSLRVCAAIVAATGCGEVSGLNQAVPPSTPAAVATVTVLPSVMTLTSGYVYASAVVRDSAGYILVGRAITWSSGDTTIATVSSDGTVIARGAGQSTITAKSEGVSATVQVVVPQPAPPASVRVVPDTVSVEVGQKWSLTAQLLDAEGRFTTTSSTVVWTSSDTTIATVFPNGLVSAVGAGTTTVNATLAGKTGRATVRVYHVLPVGSVALAPDTATTTTGGTQYFTVVVNDTAGHRVLSRPVTWSTSNAALAVVSNQSIYDGSVAALAPGVVTVIASSGGKQGTATLRINTPPQVASLSLTPASTSVMVGRTISLKLLAQDANGAEIFPATTWTSSDSAKASVRFNQVTALAAGTATISASAGGKTAQAVITVTPYSALPLTSAATGRDLSCGIGADKAAYCWGLNFFGARGDGGIVDTVPLPVPARASGNVSFASITAADYHVCGMSTTNTAYCWGSNVRGQLGVGSTSPTCVRYGSSNPCSAVPVLVSGGLSFLKISAGGSTTCAISTSSAALCWGDNSSGQLGSATTGASSTPVPVGGGPLFKDIAVGKSHACGLTTSGSAYCWGSNSAGQLGAPTRDTCTDGIGRVTGCSAVPLRVNRNITFRSISAGGDHTCAISDAEQVFCWGSNASGELGVGSTTMSDVPLQAGAGFRMVTAGEKHTCGLAPAGRAMCWGSNASAQLGNTPLFPNMAPQDQSRPVEVFGGMVFDGISAGVTHTCGMSASVAYCWGNNSQGQLGTGDQTTHGAPKLAVSTP